MAKGSVMITIKYHNGLYSCRWIEGILMLEAKPGIKTHVAERVCEDQAAHWFGDHGLRRGRARNLIAAAVRNDGPYANPAHPKRYPRQVNLPTTSVA